MARNYWHIPKDDPGHQLFLRRYRFACAHVRNAWVVYDAACGYGTGTQMLASCAREAFGFDLDSQAIQAAINLSQAENVHYEVADLEAAATWAAWKHPRPDWVVSLETHEHLKHPEAWVQRIQELASVGVVISRPIVPGLTKKKGNYSDASAADVDSWFVGWGTKVASEFHEEAWEGKVQPVYYIAAYQRKADPGA